ERISENQQRIGPRLLVEQHEHRREGSEKGGAREAQQTAAARVLAFLLGRGGHYDWKRRNADKNGKAAERHWPAAEQPAPKLQERIIEWGMRLVGWNNRPEIVPAARREPGAIGLVEPQGPHTQPNRPHAKRQQDEGEARLNGRNA